MSKSSKKTSSNRSKSKSLQKASTVITLVGLGANIASGIPSAVNALETGSSGSETSSTEVHENTVDLTGDTSTSSTQPSTTEGDNSERTDETQPSTEGTQPPTDKTDSSNTEQPQEDPYAWVKQLFPYLTEESDIEKASQMFNTDGSLKFTIGNYNGVLEWTQGSTSILMNVSNGKVTVSNSDTTNGGFYHGTFNKTALTTGESAIKSLISNYGAGLSLYEPTELKKASTSGNWVDGTSNWNDWDKVSKEYKYTAVEAFNTSNKVTKTVSTSDILKDIKEEYHNVIDDNGNPITESDFTSSEGDKGLEGTFYYYDTFRLNVENNGGTSSAKLTTANFSQDQLDKVEQYHLTNVNVKGLPYSLHLNMENDEAIDSIEVNNKELSPQPVFFSDGVSMLYDLQQANISTNGDISVNIHPTTVSALGYSKESEKGDLDFEVYQGSTKLTKDKEIITSKDGIKYKISNLTNSIFYLKNKDGEYKMVSGKVDAVSKGVDYDNLTENSADSAYRDLNVVYNTKNGEQSHSISLAYDEDSPVVSNVSLNASPNKVTPFTSYFDTNPVLTVRATDDVELDKVVIVQNTENGEISREFGLNGKSSSVDIPLLQGRIVSIKVVDKAKRESNVDYLEANEGLSKYIAVASNPNFKADIKFTDSKVLGGTPKINKTPEMTFKVEPLDSANVGNAVIKSYDILLNGKSVMKGNGNDTNTLNLTIPSSKLEGNTEGSNLVEARVTLSDGSSVNDYQNYVLDTTKPEINSGSITNDTYSTSGNILMVAGKSFDFTVSVRDLIDDSLGGEDNVSGVQKLVLTNKDTGKVTELEPNNEGIITGKLTESGEYTAYLVDNLGNKLENLKIGDIVTDLNNKSIDNLLLVEQESKVSNSISEPVYTNGDEAWYKDVPEVSVSGHNAVGFKQAKVEVNGVLVNQKVFGLMDIIKGTADKLYSYSLTEDDIKRNVGEDGKVEVVSTIITPLGRVEKDTTVFYLDQTNPTFENGVTIDGEHYIENEGIFSKKPLNISVNLSDGKDSSGIKNVIVSDSSGSTQDKKVSGNSITFSTSDKQNYSLVAHDNVGRVSETKTLKDLDSSIINENFIVDNQEPTSEISYGDDFKYTDSKGNKWYDRDQDVTVKVSDNESILEYKVYVNGVLAVDKNAKSETVKDAHETIKTSDYNAQDGAYNIKVEVTDKARNVHSQDSIIYVDKSKPEITEFRFQQDGYIEGKTFTSDDSTYGFYFKNPTTLVVTVKDEGASSGLKELRYTLGNETGVANLSTGVTEIHIPQDFKGFIKAVPVDNVGHEGEERKPDGVITESNGQNINSTVLGINLPDTPYRTADGQLLYNKPVNIGLTAKHSYSGLRDLSVLLDNNGVLSSSIDNNGVVHGDTLVINGRDKNLVTDVSTGVQFGESRNGQVVTLNTKDRSGYSSTLSKTFAVDTIEPVLTLSYDNNSADNGKYYKANRIATLTIKEVNFNANDVKFTGNVPAGITWSSNGDVHTATIPFTNDAEYNWGVSYTDLAGNVGNTIENQNFVIDKTTPKISVSYDNNDVKNGNFYNKTRVATIRVEDTNFDGSRVNVEGATLSGWSSNGNVHTATAAFANDGTYKWSVQVTDKAGNTSEKYQSEEFIIDKEAPKLSIEGVSDGGIYADEVLPVIKYSDKYLEEGTLTYTLRGNKNGVISNPILYKRDGEIVLKNLEKTKMNDDIYTLTASVTDKAGNKTEVSKTFIVNRFGSEFKILDNTFFDKQFVSKVDKDIVIQEASISDIDVNKLYIEVTRNGVATKLDKKDYTIKVDKDRFGFNVYTYTISKDVFKEEGVYSIYVKSTDVGSNENDTKSLKMVFAVDRTKPKIIISGVESGKVYNDDSKDVLIEVSDNLSLDKTSVELNGIEQPVEFTDGKASLHIQSRDKPNNLVVLSFDKAGNKQVERVDDFTISTNLVARTTNWKGTKWIIAFASTLVAFLIGLMSTRYFIARKRAKEEKERENEVKERETSSSLKSDSMSSMGDSDKTK